MSIDLVAAALWLDMEPRRKLVLVSLCENADQEGYCWPSQPYIAIRASLSVRWVRRHLRELEKDGWLKVLRIGKRASPTERVLNIDRILVEGRFREAEYRAAQKGVTVTGYLAETAANPYLAKKRGTR